MSKDNKTEKEQIAENYKKIMTEMSHLDIVNRLFKSLEGSTGLAATVPQRELVDSILQEKAMQWAEVLKNVESAMKNPEVMAEYKKKTNQGK